MLNGVLNSDKYQMITSPPPESQVISKVGSQIAGGGGSNLSAKQGTLGPSFKKQETNSLIISSRLESIGDAAPQTQPVITNEKFLKSALESLKSSKLQSSVSSRS
jgi:hypothetical protein